MAVHLRDPETDRVVRELARLTGKSLTETIRDACAEKLAAETERRAEEEQKRPLMERLEPLWKEIREHPETGLKADKAFYDWLSGEDER